jgi:hypothetical protein
MSGKTTVRRFAALHALLLASPVAAQLPDSITSMIRIEAPDPTKVAEARMVLRNEKTVTATLARSKTGEATSAEGVGPVTRDTVAAITAVRDGESTIIRVSANGRANASVSEPMHVAGHTRLILRLDDATLAGTAHAAEIAKDARLLGIEAEQHDASVRITIEADRIDSYALDNGEDGFTLRLGPAATKPADAIVSAALSAGASDNGVDDAATDATNTDATPAPITAAARFGAAATSPGGVEVSWLQSVVTWTKPVLAGAFDSAARSTASLRRAIEESGPTARWSLLAGIALLFLPLIGWRFVSGRPSRPAKLASVQVADVVAAGSGGGDARIWAARTLAGQGLDAGAIAERTGLSRDAAALVLRTMRSAKAAASGTNFRS